MKRLLLLLLLLLTISLPAISQTCNSSITASTPDSRFIVNGQEVADLQTGLIWQKCSLGQSDSTCSGTAQEYTWADALQAAEDQNQQTGQSWRLPNLNELRSILEYKCASPMINLTIFPNTPAWIYWSASLDVHDLWGPHAWAANFSDGYTYQSVLWDFSDEHVRLVRTGQ